MIVSITITLVLCYIISEVWTQNTIQEAAETDTNVPITCGGHITVESRQFWIINEALYGLLQVPREYRVLTSKALVIPTLRRDMNGSTFQCARIDHQNNRVHYGTRTQLKIIILPFELPNGMVCSILTNSINHYMRTGTLNEVVTVAVSGHFTSIAFPLHLSLHFHFHFNSTSIQLRIHFASTSHPLRIHFASTHPLRQFHRN